MTVEAGKAIWFECEKCSHGQYADYTLEKDWEGSGEDGRVVMADFVDCEKCGYGNRVIEEL